MLPVAQWTPGHWIEAEHVIKGLLEGVGSKIEHREVTRVGLHVRRLVSPEEMAMVGPATDVRVKK